MFKTQITSDRMMQPEKMSDMIEKCQNKIHKVLLE